MKVQNIVVCVVIVVVSSLCVQPAAAQYIAIPGVSTHGQGAGVAIGNFDGNNRPEMVLMAYHNSKGMNLFRYKVGKDLAPDGVAASWSDVIDVEGVGNEGNGAGAAIWDINGNGKADLVFMAYDSSKRANTFKYKVGWDLDANGIASSWSGIVEVEGVGHLAEGAGVALGDLDANGRPELILMAYDSPDGPNSFRYKVGWNLNPGAIAAEWTAAELVPGVSDEAEGAGIGIVDLDGDSIAELMLMANEKKQGDNPFRYKIGWQLNRSAKAQNWKVVDAPGMGGASQGAGIAFWDMLNNGQPEMIIMAYDRAKGGNSFRYRVTGVQ